MSAKFPRGGGGAGGEGPFLARRLYHLDESTFILGAAGVTFHFYFAFITYT